jgi:hypothetical protein
MRVNRRALVTAIGVLAAAVATATAVLALTSAAEPEAEGAKQRVAIVTQGVQNDPSSPVFELTPLQPGALERDSGTERSTLTGTVVMRKGQRVVLTHGVETLQGDRGTLEVRYRIEWVGAGHGYRVGTGTWKVVRGTGEYAEITGGGRRGDMWLKRGRGPWSGRAEGFLRAPGT